MAYTLVHDNTWVILFAESAVSQSIGTIHTIFEGTLQQCWDLIDSIPLVVSTQNIFPSRPPGPTPTPLTALQIYNNAISAGFTAPDNSVYGITDPDQLSWTKALMALSNAETALVTNLSAATVQSILGAILKKDGTLAPTMTVQQFRILMLQTTQYIGQLRATLAASS